MPDPSPSDETLMLRARAGDEEAYCALFGRYSGLLEARIRRLLSARLSRKLSVADIVQETRLLAYERRDRFDRDQGSFRNWLLGIAENKTREAVRHHVSTKKRAAVREVSRGGRPDTANFPGPSRSPSHLAGTREVAERARAVRAALPEDYREVLRLVHEEGYDLKEAAQHLGRSREAAKKLYGRAVCRFREAYLTEGGGRDG